MMIPKHMQHASPTLNTPRRGSSAMQTWHASPIMKMMFTIQTWNASPIVKVMLTKHMLRARCPSDTHASITSRVCYCISIISSPFRFCFKWFLTSTLEESWIWPLPTPTQCYFLFQPKIPGLLWSAYPTNLIRWITHDSSNLPRRL